MASGNPESSDTTFPSVLGTDGTIDLTGGLRAGPDPEKPMMRPSGDAWVVDRDRRTLMPPSLAEAPTSDPSAAAEPTRDQIHLEIADRFALGDYAAALCAAELQLGREPDDEEAFRYAETSRKRLEARYATRVGSLDFVFNVRVPASKIKWLGLDPQAAFLLSLVDGQTTVAEVLDACPMLRLEALRVFTELLDAKAIERVA